jgi:hypothetical protein
MGRIAYSFAQFFLSVFKAFKAVVKADYQIYYLIKVIRVGYYCYRVLDLRLQAVKKPRYFGPVISGNPGAVFVKFS